MSGDAVSCLRYNEAQYLAGVAKKTAARVRLHSLAYAGAANLKLAN